MMTTTHHTERKTYLGQECRIVCAYQNIDGLMGYALKTACQTIAISADKALLIDIAEDRRMNLVKIAD